MKTTNQTETLESLKEQNHFHISKISHEVRNPVTLINTYLQLIMIKHPEVTGFDYWDHIMSNIDFLKDLLNEISDFNNSQILKKESINLYVLLQRMSEELSPLLDEHNIALEIRKESALPPLDVDITKFKQALLNLIRNSIEAFSSNGHITIRIYFEDLSIVVKVEDDGPGIPKEFMPSIFDPFVTYKKEGTGLGLAITKNVIEAHNGTIQVHSTEGNGTIFTIKMPI